MGNECTVINKTDAPIFIMTYSCSNINDRFYREWRQVPVQRELGDQPDQVQVTGLPGGGAMEVAVMYNIKESTGQVVRDIFTVANGATLIIQGLTDNSGVTQYVRVEGVQMKTKGKVGTMSKEVAQFMAEIAKDYRVPWIRPVAITAVGNVAGPLATPIAAPIASPIAAPIAAEATDIFFPQGNNEYIYREIGLVEVATEASTFWLK